MVANKNTMLITFSNFLLAFLLFACDAQASEWKTIDDHLKTKVSTDYPIENMQAALSWLRTMRLSKIPPILPTKRRVFNTLKQLEQFKYRYDHVRCNKESYWLRKSLNDDHERTVLLSGESVSRINLVLLHYSFELARICRGEHASNFIRLMNLERTYPSSNSVLLDHVKPFFARLIYLRISKQPQPKQGRGQGQGQSREASESPMTYAQYLDWADDHQVRKDIYENFILNAPWLHSIDQREAQVAYEYIESLIGMATSDQVEGQSSGQAENLVPKYFEEKIIGSCRLILKYFGKLAFELAQEDTVYLDSDYVLDDVGKPFADYYLTWASCRGCWNLISHEAIGLEMGKKIEQEAGRNSKLGANSTG